MIKKRLVSTIIIVFSVFTFMTEYQIGVQLFDLTLAPHYKLIDIVSIEAGDSPWRGSLFCIGWHEGDWWFDFAFMNGENAYYSETMSMATKELLDRLNVKTNYKHAQP